MARTQYNVPRLGGTNYPLVVNFLDYVPANQHNALRAATANYNFTPDLQAALDECPNGSILEMPYGRMGFESKASVVDKNIVLKGQGRYATRMYWTGGSADGCLKMSSTRTPPYTTAQPPKYGLVGLSLMAGAHNLAMGVNIDFADDANINAPLFVDDIYLGMDIEGPYFGLPVLGFFSVGMRVNNCRNSLISRVHALGEIHANTSGQLTETMFLLEGECTDFKIRDTISIEAKTHIRSDGETEGLYIHNCDLVYGGTGLRYQCPLGEPQIVVTASHINTSEFGIYGTNILNGRFKDCLIMASAVYANTAWVGIQLDGPNSRDNTISCDYGISGFTGTKTAVKLLTGTADNIFGCKFRDMTTAVDIAAGVVDPIVALNNYVNVTTRLADASKSARVLDRSDTGGLVTQGDLELYNPSVANAVTKYAEVKLNLSDTVGSKKAAGLVRAVPDNSNVTDAAMLLQVRRSSALVDALLLRSNGRINTPTLPTLTTYADNAAATAAGLAVGEWYRTATGQLMVRY